MPDVTEYLIPDSCYRILEESGFRKLMIKSDDSASLGNMRIAEPDQPDNGYFLATLRVFLFKPDPADVLVVGLGTGQQVKFVHRRLPDTRVVALDIKPEMIAIAREWFAVPPDDERLSTLVCEGGVYVENNPGRFDLIFSDAYDDNHLVPESAGGEKFYRDSHRALREDGVFVINLFRDAFVRRREHIDNLQQSFASVISVRIGHEQVVLICFKQPPPLDFTMLTERAERLEPRYRLGLPEFAAQYVKMKS